MQLLALPSVLWVSFIPGSSAPLAAKEGPADLESEHRAGLAVIQAPARAEVGTHTLLAMPFTGRTIRLVWHLRSVTRESGFCQEESTASSFF